MNFWDSSRLASETRFDMSVSFTDIGVRTRVRNGKKELIMHGRIVNGIHSCYLPIDVWFVRIVLFIRSLLVLPTQINIRTNDYYLSRERIRTELARSVLFLFTILTIWNRNNKKRVRVKRSSITSPTSANSVRKNTPSWPNN